MKIKFEERRDAKAFAYMVVEQLEKNDVCVQFVDFIEEEKERISGCKKLKHMSLNKFKLNMSKDEIQLIVVGRNKMYEFWFEVI